ncbi:UNC-50 family protein [Toxoplasma gondii VAND]|uniref:UNC-50 family protein n=1 Tax=Toxoplasma gondii VAND TaxID=933077 RepID=A0A086PRI1_TOXGO|nr:UNC-50 family protein [Toxoplasma gondii VAND]
MLPTYHRGGCPCFPSLIPPATFMSFMSNFCHRLAHLSLMDLQFSLAQFSLLLFSPRKVYEFASIRKKQKNYYARDDPGFLLLLFFFFLVTGVVYALAFSHSAVGFLFTSLAPPVYLLLSALIFPFLHYVFLRCRPRPSHSRLRSSHSSRPREGRHLAPSSSAGPRPELLFCFDVHWNASFLYLVFGLILYLVLLPLLRLLPLTLEVLLANSVQVVGLTAYCYITALGYARLGFSDSSLPFFLPALLFLVVATVATVFSVNLGDILVSSLLYSQNQVAGPAVQVIGVQESTVRGVNTTMGTPPGVPEVSVHLESPAGK